MKEAPGGNTNSLMSDMQQKEECVSFIEAGRKVQQNPRDAFSNAWEYLHCLNCKLYFNGLPRQRCTNTVSKHPDAASAQTWLSTTRNLGQRPDLYLCYIKKKNTTLSFKNSNSTGCTFMNYDFVCTILVTTGGLWLMEIIHSIQLGFMFTTY